MPLHFYTDKKRIRILVASTCAPAAPSGLAAVSASASEIDLSWTDNSSNETGFQIQRSPDGATWATLTTAVANTTTYADTGLAAATTYYYRVSAYNLAGSSAQSNSASATTSGAAVTSYTLTGPMMNATGVASMPFTIRLAPGTLAGSVVFTPSDGGHGGTISPSTITLTNTTRLGTFTVTEASPLTASVSVTNSGLLTNPPAISMAVVNAVTIDSAWLSANGPAPYYLMSPNTYYKLATDVTVDGTAFFAMAANITLDGNGHTITYGNMTPLTVPNGDFETGDTTSWDVTGAPGATVTAARVGMFGNWMLHVPNVSVARTIVSAPIAVPLAHVQYVASMTPKCDNYGSTMTLTVTDIDAVPPVVLATSNSPDPNRGFCPVAVFNPTSTNRVQFTITLVPPSGQTVSIDLDYAQLYRAGEHGVNAGASYTYLPPYLQTPTVVSNAGHVTKFALRNATITQGQGTLYGSAPVWLRGTNTINIDSVTAICAGMDARPLELTSTQWPTVNNCTITPTVDRLSSRFLLWGAINAPNIEGGNTVLTNNTISGVIQQGITCYYRGTFPIGATALIQGNNITHTSPCTEGYGIEINNLQNFEITGNTINPVVGRGLLLDGFSSSNTQNGIIHDNVFNAIEGPNLEYFNISLEALCLRVRNDSTARFGNFQVYNNTFYSQTGSGLDWACGARIGFNNNSGQCSGSTIVFSNNTFKSILTSIDSSLVGTTHANKAWAVTLGAMDPTINLQFIGNTFESNSVTVNLGDNDSYGYTISGPTFLNNTCVKSTSGVSGQYLGICAGNFNGTVSQASFCDMLYTGGAAAGDLVFLSGTAKDVEFGYLLTITVENVSGVAQPGATVTITDATSTLRGTYTTNSSGQVVGVPAVILEKSVSVGGNNSAPVSTTLTPLTVAATAGSLSGIALISPTGDTSITITVS